MSDQSSNQTDSDSSETLAKPTFEKAGLPLFGGATTDETEAEVEAETEPESQSRQAEDFTMDSESDDEVSSFFTPSRPDSDEVGVPNKRAVPDVDSLDTLPVLDEAEAEADQGGGFFDELPPPAFSFENDLPIRDEEVSESEPVAAAAAADEEVVEESVVNDAETETEIVDAAEVVEEIEEKVDFENEADEIVAEEIVAEEIDTVESEADESAEAELISGPEVLPNPGAITGGGADRVRDIELRAVFGTTEEFTLQRIADLTLDLCSGIDSCDVLARGRTVSASRRCGAADGAEAASRGKRAKAMYRNVRDLADNAGLAQAEELTLHTETHAISFFTRGSACVTIHHERGNFRAGVREKLILVARGVAAFES